MDFAYQAYTEYVQKNHLKSDMDLAAVQLEITRFWDSVMVFVAQKTTNTYARNMYRLLIQQAKSHTDVLQWLDTPEVFYSTAAADKGKRKMPWFGIGALVLLAALVAWFGFPPEGKGVPYGVLYAVLIGVALLMMLVQFVVLFSAVLTSPAVNIRTEQRISPEKVKSGLSRMVREMDSNADSLMAMVSETVILKENVDVSLAQELLRLPRNYRSEEVTNAVDQFLIRSNVEKIEYSREHQELFMVLPGPCEMTVEPALVRNGNVLSMGVACAVVEE